MYKEVRVASVDQNVDAFLTASTSETCGLSALEALASELSIVVPHAQGLRDLVQHEEHALRRRLSEVLSRSV
jgi:glycosyltransferase involved in cell wall biosynthesis